MPANSLALRLVAGAGLWIAAALIAGGALLSALCSESAERSFDARLVVLLESLVAVSDLGADGALRLTRAVGEPRFEQVYSGWYWQIDVPGADPLRSRSLWDQSLAADGRGTGGTVERFAAAGPEARHLRVVARAITLPGADAPVRYSVAAEPAEIEGEVRAFNAALAWSLGGLGLGLVVAVFVQVRFGLGPLRRLRAALIAVRAGQADRLRGDFPSEIKPLSDEVNILLEHNAAVVERARTHVSNLAHPLKTPLAVLANEAGAALGPLAETVRRQTAAIRRHVDHYLSRARTAATGAVLGARTEVAPAIEDLRRTVARIHADRGLAIETTCAPDVVFRGERQDIEEMVGNLLDNACKWARSRVRVVAAADGARLTVAVEDDGPGLAEEQRDAVFGRGRRLDESVPGSGLGLSIVRDIAELYGGGISLGRSSLGGLRAELDLPTAAGAA